MRIASMTRTNDFYTKLRVAVTFGTRARISPVETDNASAEHQFPTRYIDDVDAVARNTALLPGRSADRDRLCQEPSLPIFGCAGGLFRGREARSGNMYCYSGLEGKCGAHLLACCVNTCACFFILSHQSH